MKKLLTLTAAILALSACQEAGQTEAKDQQAVARQQQQYQIGQPVPAYDWSLERDLLIQLYNMRNREVATHSVWRSAMGLIEGDCPSMGYGIPYDTSLTNPLQAIDVPYHPESAVVEQAEPNGVFPSKNTSATWVFCVGPTGALEPMFVETMVTVYPGPVSVDYGSNRVVRRGDATVTLAPSN